MKCHYEVLDLPKTCSLEDVKKNYRRLALEWHPDKNLHRLDEARQEFQLIQQAYEVLTDPRERAWYDRHRDAILCGDLEKELQDKNLDVFQYFNTSCYKGYGDDETGFYSIYREVFDRIISEDSAFVEDSIAIPRFGDATSSYDEVVHPFYGYWQSYCTSKSYSWVDQYDIQEAPNRRILRLMEKENKKMRDQAKKARNEEIRQLVAFVRKRDKRVQVHKRLLEKKAAENTQKVEEYRMKQFREKRKNCSEYRETEWMSLSALESNLTELEAELDQTFGRDFLPEDTANEEDEDSAAASSEDLYCLACDKAFRSEKAKANHENSKKHKQNVVYLRAALEAQDDESISEHEGAVM